MEAIEFVKNLIDDGKKVGIFSCEDPYNTPFHKDLLQLTSYLHLKTVAGSRVVPATLDLGLQAKGINAWGVFGHYGKVNGHDVCAAIGALKSGYDKAGKDFKKDLDVLAQEFSYEPQKSLKDNVVDWVKSQYELLLKLIPEKQRTIEGAVQGDIVVFAGLVENSKDAKSYQANILFSNLNGPGH